jgi:hypothetical protein
VAAWRGFMAAFYLRSGIGLHRPACFDQSREGARGRLILGILGAAAAFNSVQTARKSLSEMISSAAAMKPTTSPTLNPAEIYGWFTEGFNTADLKEAKALLDELSA